MLLAIWEPVNFLIATPTWILGVEGLILSLFWADIFLKIAYVGFKKFIRKQHHYMLFGVVSFYTLDWVLYVLSRGNTPRFSRPFRPGYLMTRHREMRRTVYSLFRMVPDLTGLFLGLSAYILFFALLGIYIFTDQYNSFTPPAGVEEYPIPGAFNHVGIAFLRLYVLFSTENYPAVALPAFDHNRLSIVYFVVYVYFGVFFLNSMLLAIIVSIYLERAGKQVGAALAPMMMIDFFPYLLL